MLEFLSSELLEGVFELLLPRLSFGSFAEELIASCSASEEELSGSNNSRELEIPSAIISFGSSDVPDKFPSPQPTQNKIAHKTTAKNAVNDNSIV